MKEEKENFIDALPVDWRYDRLKDMVSLRNEKTDESSDEEDYLELEDMESGTGRILSRRNTLETVSAVTLFKKGDVLFGKLRPYLEKYYEAEFDGKCTGEILAFKPERITSRFLFYCIASPWFIERCIMMAYGAKMPRVNWPTQLALFNLPLPPQAEQERIAAYLDSSCAAIDAAVAAKRRQLELLYSIRKSIIHRAVTQGINTNIELRDSEESWLGKVPAHWTRSRIRNVATLSPGYSRQPPSKQEECTIIPMELLSNDGLIDVSNQFPLEEVQTGLTLFEEGDVIFAKITPCMENGKGAFVNYLPTRYGFGSTEFHVLRPSHVVLGKFLYYVTWNSIYRAYAAENMTGAAGQKRVSSRFLKDTRLFLPSLFEQKTICSFLDTKIAELKRITTCIQQQITTLLTYRKSLIHECVTGQRRVTEADVTRVVQGKSEIEGSA